MLHLLPPRLAATSQNAVGISITSCSVTHCSLKRSTFWGYPTGAHAFLLWLRVHPGDCAVES